MQVLLGGQGHSRETSTFFPTPVLFQRAMLISTCQGHSERALVNFTRTGPLEVYLCEFWGAFFPFWCPRASVSAFVFGFRLLLCLGLSSSSLSSVFVFISPVLVLCFCCFCAHLFFSNYACLNGVLLRVQEGWWSFPPKFPGGAVPPGILSIVRLIYTRCPQSPGSSGCRHPPPPPPPPHKGCLHNRVSRGSPKQSKAKQGKAKQSKARQGSAKQSKAMQGKAKEN
jgi:hypothetical protein